LDDNFSDRRLSNAEKASDILCHIIVIFPSYSVTLGRLITKFAMLLLLSF
jgi:hypothetical protein